MNHTTQTAAQHCATIQRQIDALDSYAASRPLTDGQKQTIKLRRKIYTDLLASAQALYEAVRVLDKENQMLRDNIKLQASIQLLRDSRPSAAGFAAWQAEYLQKGKKIVRMDFNKYQTI